MFRVVSKLKRCVFVDKPDTAFTLHGAHLIKLSEHAGSTADAVPPSLLDVIRLRVNELVKFFAGWHMRIVMRLAVPAMQGGCRRGATCPRLIRVGHCGAINNKDLDRTINWL